MDGVLCFLLFINTPMNHKHIANHAADMVFKIATPIVLSPISGGYVEDIDVRIGELLQLNLVKRNSTYEN